MNPSDTDKELRHQLRKILGMCREKRCSSQCTQQLGSVMKIITNQSVRDRQSELAKTVLAGMPELTPRQQEYVTNRIQQLEAELTKEEK